MYYPGMAERERELIGPPHQEKFEIVDISENGESVPVFEPQSEESKREEAREQIRSTVRFLTPGFIIDYRRGTTVIPPGEGDEVIRGETPALVLGLRTLASYATHLNEVHVHQAGFESREELFGTTLDWVGEAWTEAGYGDVKMDIIRGETQSTLAQGLRDQFQRDVEMTQRGLRGIAESLSFFPAPPLRDEALEAKLDEKFGKLP